MLPRARAQGCQHSARTLDLEIERTPPAEGRDPCIACRSPSGLGSTACAESLLTAEGCSSRTRRVLLHPDPVEWPSGQSFDSRRTRLEFPDTAYFAWPPMRLRPAARDATSFPYRTEGAHGRGVQLREGDLW